jgi:SHS2 domain-containing protein
MIQSNTIGSRVRIMGRWEHFPHEADTGIRGFGRTKAEAFEQAALALTAAVCDPSLIRPRQTIMLECEAPDDELLLVEWLNQLIYQMATRKMLFAQFVVAFDNGKLHGQASGEPIDAARHDVAVEAKGATYTSLRVACDAGEWVAQTVVDV